MRQEIPAEYSRLIGGRCELVTNGESGCVIIYDRLKETARTYAEQIQQAIAAATGYTPVVKADYLEPTGFNEILVGDTNRLFSQLAFCDFMGYGMFYQPNRNSIALTGQLEFAVKKFISMIEQNGSEGSLAFDSELFEGYTKLDGYGRIPAYREEKCDFIAPSDLQSYFVIYEHTSPEEYRAYLKRLKEQECFTEYASREINGNLFATYTDGETNLTVNYTAYDGKVRIMADSAKVSSLYNRESDCGEVVTTPQLTQINGRCSFLFRLSDGRFLMFDGGVATERNSEWLLKQLQEQNVLPGKPVIAAWMFSHMHSDHVGGFIGFAEAYGDQVELQSVVVNLPSFDIYSIDGASVPAKPTQLMLYGIPGIKATLEKYFAHTKLIIPHNGQTMWFGDAQVDVVYAQEDLAPMPMNATNNSTTVYLISLGGQRVALIGDVEYDAADIMCAIYGGSGFLKCDFVQAAHHGCRSGSHELYKEIGAWVSFWTETYTYMRTCHPIRCRWQNPRNCFDVNKMKENLMMEDRSAMVVPLPYKLGSLPEYLHPLTK